MPKAGLEPARQKTPPPQDGASTSSATSAIYKYSYIFRLQIYSTYLHEQILYLKDF